jgi:hypothetical protein
MQVGPWARREKRSVGQRPMRQETQYCHGSAHAQLKGSLFSREGLSVTFLTSSTRQLLPLNAERLTACSFRCLYVRTAIQMTWSGTLTIALSDMEVLVNHDAGFHQQEEVHDRRYLSWPPRPSFPAHRLLVRLTPLPTAQIIPPLPCACDARLPRRIR